MAGVSSIARKAADEVEWQMRVDLAACYRLCVRFGFHEGICNHLSVMLPGGNDRFLINAYGYHWSEITASNLLLCDADGHVLAGNGEVEDTAFYIHSRLHLNVPDAVCVLHTHQPYATALTMIEKGRLQPAIQSAVRFYDRIAYDDIFDGYQGLALDNAEGDRMAQAMGDKEVMFLENHGVVVAGPTIAQAMDALYYLERACKMQVLAMSTGAPMKVLSDNLAKHANQQIMRHVADSSARHFQSLKRLLDRDEPDYAH